MENNLTDVLDYNPDTGHFTWLVSLKSGSAGKRAGHLKKNKGYRYIEVYGKTYAEHRLAWLFVNGSEPKDQIDHINGVKDDNRISNLREATNAQNRSNTRSTNKHGLKGVAYKPWIKNKPWQASITNNKKVIYIGCFATKEEAHFAYLAKAKELMGDFVKINPCAGPEELSAF